MAAVRAVAVVPVLDAAGVDAGLRKLAHAPQVLDADHGRVAAVLSGHAGDDDRVHESLVQADVARGLVRAKLSAGALAV